MKRRSLFTAALVIAASFSLVVVLGALLGTSYSATPPVEAVRPVSTNGDNYCSAVVIAPETALTARHCIKEGMEVAGMEVAKITTSGQFKDVAVLYVPGLECPCSPLGANPVVGDQVLAVGFPAVAQGNRVISPIASVRHVGELTVVLPDYPDKSDPMMAQQFIVTDAPIINPGDSGGALFSRQDGEWRLVGVNVIGIPDLSTCSPFGCEVEVGSGFVPVDIVKEFL